MSEATQSFSSFQEWINKATSWLTRHEKYGNYFHAICFDSTGRICKNGRDFETAVYPVYWIWPDQNLFNMVDSVKREGVNFKKVTINGVTEITPEEFDQKCKEYWIYNNRKFLADMIKREYPNGFKIKEKTND